MTTPPPRAVRNQNPGNIEANSIPWKGLADITEMTFDQRKEQRFCVFTGAVWGFRALAVLIRNYRDRYGLITVHDIISRFAPSNENDVSAYISRVCASMGVEANKVLDLSDRAVLTAFCRAIAEVESGGWFFETKDLDKGVAMALPLGEAMV